MPEWIKTLGKNTFKARIFNFKVMKIIHKNLTPIVTQTSHNIKNMYNLFDMIEEKNRIPRLFKVN